MRMWISFLPGPLAVALALTGCGTGSRKPAAALVTIDPPSRVTRQETLSMAARYADHKWRGTDRNVLHGPDRAGIRVDTPDVTFTRIGENPGYWIPDQISTGIPYQWGGFNTPAEFDSGVARGLAAGDVYTAVKRKLLDAGVSRDAVGIDCSGLVSRCWKLPRSFSTRELAAVCDPLPSWEDLRPGDILNTWNNHVVLFAGWTDGNHRKMVIFETVGAPEWKAMRRELPRVHFERKGFRALRYRGIRD